MRRRTARWTFALLLAASAGGCTVIADTGRFEFVEMHTETDAGETDAGETDAAETDAGETDAGGDMDGGADTDGGDTDGGIATDGG